MVDAEIVMTANLVVKEGALERRQKEYIFLVCSAANLSTYCVTAHCEIVRMLKLEGPEPEQIAIDHVHANIPIADKALLNFCTKLNSQPSKIGPNDIETLRTYGFTEQQILEAILIVGWAKFAALEVVIAGDQFIAGCQCDRLRFAVKDCAFHFNLAAHPLSAQIIDAQYAAYI